MEICVNAYNVITVMAIVIAAGWSIFELGLLYDYKTINKTKLKTFRISMGGLIIFLLAGILYTSTGNTNINKYTLTQRNCHFTEAEVIRLIKWHGDGVRRQIIIEVIKLLELKKLTNRPIDRKEFEELEKNVRSIIKKGRDVWKGLPITVGQNINFGAIMDQIYDEEKELKEDFDNLIIYLLDSEQMTTLDVISKLDVEIEDIQMKLTERLLRTIKESDHFVSSTQNHIRY